jgi:hypothetical protein
MMMKEPDQAGARHLFLEFMRGLDQEMAFGQSLISDQEMIRAKTVMTGLLGMIDSNLLTDIQPHLTWLISTMTTYAQRGMEFLMQEKLL